MSQYRNNKKLFATIMKSKHSLKSAVNKTIGQGATKAITGLLQRITGRSGWPSNSAEWRGAAISYSQCSEDLLILGALNRLGITGSATYVDVGACDPIMYSNTLRLHQMGWRGINIDANPDNIERFRQLRQNDINLCVAVDEKETETEFLIYPEATTGRLSRTSTIGESLCQEKPLRRIPVKVQRLASVLENYFPLESMFGLLSVDVEGAELGVLRSNDWERYRPRVLAIEDLQGPKHSDIDAFCVERGYSFFAYAIATKIFVSW